MPIKYSQEFLDIAKKSTADAIEIASKRSFQKTAEAVGDLIDNKIADKITSLSKESSRELQNNVGNHKIEVPKGRWISPEKKQQIIDELWLV